MPALYIFFHTAHLSVTDLKSLRWLAFRMEGLIWIAGWRDNGNLNVLRVGN